MDESQSLRVIFTHNRNSVHHPSTHSHNHMLFKPQFDAHVMALNVAFMEFWQEKQVFKLMIALFCEKMNGTLSN